MGAAGVAAVLIVAAAPAAAAELPLVLEPGFARMKYVGGLPAGQAAATNDAGGLRAEFFLGEDPYSRRAPIPGYSWGAGAFLYMGGQGGYLSFDTYGQFAIQPPQVDILPRATIGVDYLLFSDSKGFNSSSGFDLYIGAGLRLRARAGSLVPELDADYHRYARSGANGYLAAGRVWFPALGSMVSLGARWRRLADAVEEYGITVGYVFR
ncbi:MAG TPA: hypothetical protein VH880_05995 [Anaeromyxobacteraceae bacterium]|jgi:hypothetical protein